MNPSKSSSNDKVPIFQNTVLTHLSFLSINAQSRWYFHILWACHVFPTICSIKSIILFGI